MLTIIGWILVLGLAGVAIIHIEEARDLMGARRARRIKGR